MRPSSVGTELTVARTGSLIPSSGMEPMPTTRVSTARTPGRSASVRDTASGARRSVTKTSAKPLVA
jgi:hypothetical protein